MTKRIFKGLLKFLLFVAIIGGGIAIFQYFANSKKEPERKEAVDTTMVVETAPVRLGNETVVVTAMGTVTPSRTVTLYPEVSGKVANCSSRLIPGGRFKKGETILRIDATEYDLVLKQQQAQVAQARMDLSMERGRKAVAEREWNLIQDEIQPTEDGKRLALREVQLETAEIALSAAQSGLERAKLNRNRTVIKAPFDALVTDKSVDRGQVIGPGTPIATLVDSRKFWINVSVPVHQLAWIKIPNVHQKESSTVLVKQEIGNGNISTYSGRVLKLLGGVDPKGKMARLLIEVADPLTPLRRLSGTGESLDGSATTFPLLLDAYVTVEIEGPMLENVVELARHAVRKNENVWVLGEDQTLKIKKVGVLWTRGQKAYVRGSLNPGENVIVSRIDAPVEGMKLRAEQEGIETARAATQMETVQ